jgi:hypothetical protein
MAGPRPRPAPTVAGRRRGAVGDWLAQLVCGQVRPLENAGKHGERKPRPSTSSGLPEPWPLLLLSTPLWREGLADATASGQPEVQHGEPAVSGDGPRGVR